MKGYFTGAVCGLLGVLLWPTHPVLSAPPADDRYSVLDRSRRHSI